MTWEAWAAVLIILASVAAMARGVAAPDLVLTGALGLLLALGILTPAEAATGFGNEGMLTVGVLFVVAAGIENTGAMDWAVRRVLGRPRSVGAAQLRMMAPVATMSPFLNNTPVVAMMLPIVQDWAKRIGVSSSKLLIPLSWATILGGTVTIIGTSTNLVVTGLASQRHPELSWTLFEIAPIGLVVAAIGLTYIIVFSRWLLPDRSGNLPTLANARDYSVAFRVEADSPVVGQTIEAAGLRHLPGLYLVEIERNGEALVAVAPDTRIRAADILLFVGLLEGVVDLRKIRGLSPAAADQVRKLGVATHDRCLVEAVVAHGSALTGKTVREAAFRTYYRAAIIAVHRNGARLRSKVGDIELRTGDTLLLETQSSFLRDFRNDRNFALVSEVDRSTPVRHERGWVAVLALVGMVLANALGFVPLFSAAIVCAGVMLLARCLTGPEARRALDVGVLLAIASSFGLGTALETTGAAKFLGQRLVELTAPAGPLGVLFGVYGTVMVLTELITNNAAAALLLPVAIEAGAAAGLPIKAMCYVVMFAASASFMTPIGYQTNLMVYGPGGYRFRDFFRFGAPLQLLLAAVTVLTIYTLHVR